jgi:hypothetical protein
MSGKVLGFVAGPDAHLTHLHVSEIQATPRKRTLVVAGGRNHLSLSLSDI